MNETATNSAKHSIQVVSSRTGLSPDVIRAWERRYRAVEPHRSATQRRLYSDGDIERLVLLRRATLAGRRIGDVARLPLPELSALVREDAEAMTRVPRARELGARAPAVEQHFKAVLAAATGLNAGRIEEALHRASLELELTSLFDGVLTPVLEEVGDGWLRGRLSIAHEHLLTAQVRALLDRMRNAFSHSDAPVTLITATPSGEFHELGALKVAVLASVDGWRSVHLGADLPSGEIITAAATLGVRAVGLSVVYDEHDPQMEAELRAICEKLPDDVSLLVGGRAARLYLPTLAKFDAIVPESTAQLRRELERLR